MVTYVLATYFDLYRVIIREVYTQACRCTKFSKKCAFVELKYHVVNYSY